ncbi:hypothetical protein SAMN05216180_0767 [Hydrogenoanaerobacterium saccharovorans]|uniref:Uncharacterized protein n=1 Tax=Hydrogenoanaerobacterium saccharovorans TaxID=474960 RepID=A0A1H7ZMB9_9FIRM|nr:hypothetical protein SAMN05216180_0767 [Hydrogenoanaerobacterium saccharovorans]
MGTKGSKGATTLKQKRLHCYAGKQAFLSQKFDSIKHFKAQLIECLGYCNNRRIKAKLKGLPSSFLQTTSPFSLISTIVF